MPELVELVELEMYSLGISEELAELSAPLELVEVSHA